MRALIMLFTSLLVLGTAEIGEAKLELVKDGKSSYCIILGNDASLSERRAANELSKFLAEISGTTIPIAPDGQRVPAKCILIGDSKALRGMGLKLDPAELGDEGYLIKTVGSRLIIAGGRLRGTMYGVYAFLEDVLGCRWYSSKVSKIPKMPSIVLPNLNITGRPAFEYRDVFYTDAFDKDWAARNRTNGATAKLDDETGGRITFYPFCHTFEKLVPLEKYWDTHPEYFSMVDGKRVKDQTQLCLTNPDVLKIATETVLAWMRDHPDATLYSVSQNDWGNNCQCDKCRAINEEEGSPSGLLLRFVNAVAEAAEKEHPDKLIETLAYQWTEKPPKITKPHKNVRIRLCPISCCEAHPYTQCNAKENRAFVENLKNWAKITDNLYIWHYNTSFSHYLNPFPDLSQLPTSARLYKQTGVKGVFWEGNYSPGGGGEFAELRAYLLAKLSWDPSVDSQKVMDDFLMGYYGASSTYIREYIKLLEDKVSKDKIHFKIWAAPTESYLTHDIVAKADELLAKAESAAESDEIRDRVKRVRLSIVYVKLMSNPGSDSAQGKQKRLVAVVQGRVQGVGFRYYVAEQARMLHLFGTCRNLRNGDVEVIAEGEEGALEAMLVALKQGPRSAHVENVHAIWLPPTSEFRTFTIAATR